MTDREKVIRGLEFCSSSGLLCAGEKCSYNSHALMCKYYLMRDAFALLREQEARVLTLDELHSDLWIWMEYPGEEEGYGNYIGYAYLEGRMIEDWCFLTAGAKERLVCPLESYGQVWRCWTSRPTPEQMRDTKWEEMP